MRALWPIERNVFETVAQGNLALADTILSQAAYANVTSFENTGHGFFSELTLRDDPPLLPEESPLEGGYWHVESLDFPMGFLLFVDNGHACTIEGYCNGDPSSHAVDFSRVPFTRWRGA